MFIPKVFASLCILISFQRTQSATSPPNRSAKFLDRYGIQPTQFNAGSIGNGNVYYTNLESLRDLMLYMRNESLVKSLANLKELLHANSKAGRLQQIVPDEYPFPCDLTDNPRSKTVPTNIGQLRPGDIDIVAAFGDSVTAGNGLLSKTWQDITNEYRGLTFTGGGIETWRTALTLPNILKLYNPQLYGYAIGHSLMVDKKVSGFNLGEPMLTIRDLPFQARVLIERMRTDPKVNMKEHWKLLTIYVGLNDMCFEICDWNQTEEYLALQWKQFHHTFSLLRDNIPRLMINVIPPADGATLWNLISRAPKDCRMHLLCSCLGFKRRERYVEAIKRLLTMPMQMAELEEFQREDFVIVSHNIYRNLANVFMTNNAMDMRFFSHDCMHHSQRAHAILASALWNSMLEKFKPNETETNWRRPVQNLLCPSEGRRFLRIR